jgi:hypothetical protein
MGVWGAGRLGRAAVVRNRPEVVTSWVCAQVIAAKEAGNKAPVQWIEGHTFLLLRVADMYLVCVSRSNLNAGA